MFGCCFGPSRRTRPRQGTARSRCVRLAPVMPDVALQQPVERLDGVPPVLDGVLSQLVLEVLGMELVVPEHVDVQPVLLLLLCVHVTPPVRRARRPGRGRLPRTGANRCSASAPRSRARAGAEAELDRRGRRVASAWAAGHRQKDEDQERRRFIQGSSARTRPGLRSRRSYPGSVGVRDSPRRAGPTAS